jgi:hypothetical protein
VSGGSVDDIAGRTPVTIGGYAPAYFNRYIDELRIWNITRSAADLSSTMNHTLLGNDDGPHRSPRRAHGGQRQSVADLGSFGGSARLSVIAGASPGRMRPWRFHPA